MRESRDQRVIGEGTEVRVRSRWLGVGRLRDVDRGSEYETRSDSGGQMLGSGRLKVRPRVQRCVRVKE